MQDLQMYLNRIEYDLLADYDNHQSYKDSITPKYRHASGRMLNLEEVKQEGLNDDPIIGALKLTYCQGRFLCVDRIKNKHGKYFRQRRILYKLEEKSGQIGAALLIELLKIPTGSKFSKHKVLRDIENNYFKDSGHYISSSDLNETISRMFRHTFSEYFSIKGRNLVHHDFLVKIDELTLGKNETFQMYRRRIDEKSDRLIHSLNRQSVIT